MFRNSPCPEKAFASPARTFPAAQEHTPTHPALFNLPVRLRVKSKVGKCPRLT